MAGMLMFHSRTGSLVTLSNGNRTAQRNQPTQEFNNGVVLSAEPLRDNQLFEVRIDRKVNSWSGSIEIGVSQCDPLNLNFPISATGFRDGTWVMSGSSILKDGHSMNEEYGRDLDQLVEGDTVGVMRTSQGRLHFYVNGGDQGPAASDVPPGVYAVVDMYGKCAQVSIVDPLERDNVRITSNLANDLANEFLEELSNQIANDLAANRSFAALSEEEDMAMPLASSGCLTFHDRCGSLVKLTNGRRTAERRRPLDEFNNGVVMTSRPLQDDEVFEIRLDRLVDKWSGSIEVGITTHNPNMMDFPATMTNMRSGTTMMSGCGILTNGKGTRREYGQYNLDELAEGDRIGLVRKSNGNLHYFINGIDQGIATTNTPKPVWGVVDLYGMAVKVTILDRSDPSYAVSPPPTERRANSVFRHYPDMYDEETLDDEDEVEKLTFHPHCGAHAAVINNNRTAHRPNAFDDFNNGVVLTSRALRPDELFEVRLDRMVEKWAGSIEIGVTLHSSSELDFPSTMTNLRSGTWMMTGNGVMHNGTTIIDDYGQNLDRLKVNDRVGVMRRRDGTLHFFVNGVDQGPAATNVPENVHGVIDLYGQAAQATIVSPNGRRGASNRPNNGDLLSSPDLESSVLGEMEELKFHHLHGRNTVILNGGRTAARPNATAEFNDAIVMSNRPLRDNELFEVLIDKMVDRWSGSIEAGVTLVKPEDLDFPNTMTDIDYDTWMLSGSAIMQDGATVRNGYPLDLDAVSMGCRIGMMRRSDATLHFFWNGRDMGQACSDIPAGVFGMLNLCGNISQVSMTRKASSLGVYAVVDLYGQCSQVTITSGSGLLPNDNQSEAAVLAPDTEPSITSIMQSGAAEITHRFSQCCGKHIALQSNGSTAKRSKNYDHGLVFSSEPLKYDELFEVKVESVCRQWSGAMSIGLTTMAISDTTPVSQLPPSATQISGKVTWVVSGSQVMKNGAKLRQNYSPALERLEVGDRVGVKRCSDGTMHIFLNGVDLGVAACNIPKNVFAVIDIYGSVEQVTVTSTALVDSPVSLSQSLPLSTQADRDQDVDTAAGEGSLSFSTNHGKNVLLTNGGLTAERTASYNQALVVTGRPLPPQTLFQVRIDKINPRWSASLMVGVLGFSPERFTLPVSAMAIKKSAIIIQGSSVYVCGTKVRERYGPDLDALAAGHLVGILVDDESCLHLYVNGMDQGIAMRDVPQPCFALLDLYGQCQQVTIVGEDESILPPVSTIETREKADLEDVMKEKVNRTNHENNLLRSCEYQNICSRLRTSLGLPDGYFDYQQNMCYCETCHKIRGDDLYLKRGEPPRDYALPFGWCRFVLRAPSKAHSLNVGDKWHTAYYGTRVELLRRLLDFSDLFLPNDVSSGTSILLPQLPPFTEKSRPESLGGRQLFFSPTIRYAGSHDFAPKHRFVDPKTRKQYWGRVALQIWVKPGSYKVGPQSLGAADQIDPHFSNNELEWSTKERGSTMLHALLIKVE